MVLKKLGPGGYFNVLVVLAYRAFQRCFALDRAEMSPNGGINDEGKSIESATTFAGDEGESRYPRDEHPQSESPRDELVEYI